MELIALGGPVVIVLLGLSALGLAVVLFKLVQYRPYSKAMFDRAEQTLMAWGKGQAHTESDIKSGSYIDTLHRGMDWLESGRKPEKVREELTRKGQSLMSHITGMNGFIEQIAYLAPLLGLLGTVLGMIDVFRGLANQGGGGDTGALAGGIWEALMTTAVGLTVAIPFALIYYMLDSHATTIRRSMEDQLTRLFTVKLYDQP